MFPVATLEKPRVSPLNVRLGPVPGHRLKESRGLLKREGT